MPDVNEEWARDQFVSAKVRVVVGKAVLELLDVWKTLELKPEHAKNAVEVFSKIALNHSLIDPPKDEVWVPAQAGFLTVGEEVRVMNDAFSDSTGAMHIVHVWLAMNQLKFSMFDLFVSLRKHE
jgi:hypothetical protein